MSASDPDRAYVDAVLSSWADTHKRGALASLILLALADHSGWSHNIRAFLDDISDGRFHVDDQSLHRTSRRLDGLNLITYATVSAPGTGVKRKIYTLTATGAYALAEHLDTTLSYERHPRYRAVVARLATEPRAEATAGS